MSYYIIVFSLIAVLISIMVFNRSYNMEGFDNIKQVVVKKPNGCLFTNKEICDNKMCQNINWGAPSNMNSDCKLLVDMYCKNNKTDKGCIKIGANTDNCKQCISSIDLSKYVLKEKNL